MSNDSIVLKEGDLVKPTGLWDPNEAQTGVIIQVQRVHSPRLRHEEKEYIVYWPDGTTSRNPRWFIEKVEENKLEGKK